MAKAIMVSIRPEWCVKIAHGEKTVEVRKTRPKLATPFKCYICCTQSGTKKFWTGPRYSYADDHSHNQFDRCGNGKVIGEFVCDNVRPIMADSFIARESADEALRGTCLTQKQLKAYADWGRGKALYNCKDVYGWHISKLQIYDKPRELGELRKYCENSWYCESCAMFNAADETCGNAALEVRPPRSWCYVEGLWDG